MEQVRKLLELARLPPKAMYDEAFEAHGYDDIHWILGLGPDELAILKRETGMLHGHFMRLLEAIQLWNERARGPSSSTLQTSGNPSNNVETGHYTGHGTGHAALPVVAAASSSSTTGPQLTGIGPASVMGPPQVLGPVGAVLDESTPTTVPVTTTAAATVAAVEEEIPEYFKNQYADWQTARLVSLNHSTFNGCSVVQDRKRSGARYRVFICRSMGPKRRREESSSCSLVGPQCPHELHWARNKSGLWQFLHKQSTIAHKPFCSSGQRVSSFELVHDPEFVKHVRNEKRTTGGTAANAALGNCGRMAGSVNDYTARRARNSIKNWNLKDYKDDFCKLRPWGEEFERLNPGSRFRFKLEPGTNKFQRCFVSIAATIHIAHGVGMRFSAVDAAFSKHTIYRQGYLHLLTTRDGNNKIMVLAWAMCETESGDTYEWFAQQCHDAGISSYLNRGIIYSDRQKGINKFHDKFAAFVGRCYKHIIDNARDHVRGSGQTFQEATAWELQRAPTEVAFKAVLRKMKKESPLAAKYFDTETKPHDTVYEYAQVEKRVPTHGFKTSQIVECHNGVFVDARFDHPYYLNTEILEWQGNKLTEYYLEMREWAKKHPLTPYAYKLFQIQVFGPAHACYWAQTFGPVNDLIVGPLCR